MRVDIRSVCFVVFSGVLGLQTALAALSCSMRQPLRTLMLTSSSNRMEYRRNFNVNLGSGQCDLWTFPKATADELCFEEPNNPQFLSFEFWRTLDSTSNYTLDDDRLFEDIYFLAARGRQPMVSYESLNSGYSLDPPRAFDAQRGDFGTYQDVTADSYQRAYHRFLVPINASSTIGNGVMWYLTVANLNSQVQGGLTMSNYFIRVMCVGQQTPQLCPDPRPEVNPAVPCSGIQGACVAPPAGTRNPSLNMVCNCPPGRGDYGCNKVVPTLGMSQEVPLVLGSGGWSFLQLTVPPPGQGVTKPTLLVEMTKMTNSSAYGGDPVLLVKPHNTADRNVPWITDLEENADLRSYFLQQNYHYQMFRTLPEGGVSLYIGVFNNDRRFDASMMPQRSAYVVIRWRYRGPTGVASQGLCPADCSGQGRCFDTMDVRSVDTLPAPILPPLLNPTTTADFLCACNKGYGGTMCEGALRNTTLGDSNPMYSVTVPGQWDFYLVRPLVGVFNYANDVITIDWRDQDPVRGSLITNLFLTVDEHAFPRESQLDSLDPFRRGWQFFYYLLAARSDPPVPLQIKGTDLKAGLTYVLGVYNSQYLQSSTNSYRLDVYVPQKRGTWLHPYMSVVLGVTAAIILCLFMTLCKRFLQRHGFTFWGRTQRLPNGMLMQDGQTPVTQVAPRPQGVPGSVISTFRTYAYGATKAEKAQLIKSKRAAAERKVECDAYNPAPAAPGTVPLSPSVRPSQDLGPAASLHVPVQGRPSADSARLLAAGKEADPRVSLDECGPGVADTHSDGDEPQCTVCLCEYEEGEKIMQLPCQHDFHSMCIAKWMQTHNTCPICRIMLVPDELPDESDGADDMGGSGTVRIAARPGSANRSRARGFLNRLMNRGEDGGGAAGAASAGGQPALPPPPPAAFAAAPGVELQQQGVRGPPLFTPSVSRPLEVLREESEAAGTAAPPHVVLTPGPHPPPPVPLSTAIVIPAHPPPASPSTRSQQSRLASGGGSASSRTSTPSSVRRPSSLNVAVSGGDVEGVLGTRTSARSHSSAGSLAPRQATAMEPELLSPTHESPQARGAAGP